MTCWVQRRTSLEPNSFHHDRRFFMFFFSHGPQVSDKNCGVFGCLKGAPQKEGGEP